MNHLSIRIESKLANFEICEIITRRIERYWEINYHDYQYLTISEYE